jgi:ribosomal protein S27E
VNEAIKLLTYGSQTLNTYYMYMGGQGLYASVFEYGRKVNGHRTFAKLYLTELAPPQSLCITITLCSRCNNIHIIHNVATLQDTCMVCSDEAQTRNMTVPASITLAGAF